MDKVNRYGLSRFINTDIARQIRQACGFGCVICGDAIFQYEHIDPEYADALEHDPNKMAALCGACHDKVTRGFWSKEKVEEARLIPFCKQKGNSHAILDISKRHVLIIRIGKTEFSDLQTIIEIDNEKILSVSPPEEHTGPPRITARFFNQNDKEISSIIDNVWFGSSDAFDIEAKGGRFVIHNTELNIDLSVALFPPNIFQIDQINLSHKGAHIFGSSSTGFRIELKNASLLIPPRPKRISQAPFWLSIRDNKIALGSECVGQFNSVDHIGYYEIQDADVEMVDPNSIGSPFNNDAWKITGRKGNGLFLVKFLEPSLFQMPEVQNNLIEIVKPKSKKHKKKQQ